MTSAGRTSSPEKGPYRQWLAVGTVLRGDDGPAVVLGPDHDALDGLRMLLEYEYGGIWTRDEPGLAEVAATLTVSVWRSCTQAWRDSNIYDEYADSWWSEEGDGARSVRVLWWPTTRGEGIYDLGERLTQKGSSQVSAPASTLVSGGNAEAPDDRA